MNCRPQYIEVVVFLRGVPVCHLSHCTWSQGKGLFSLFHDFVILNTWKRPISRPSVKCSKSAKLIFKKSTVSFLHLVYCLWCYKTHKLSTINRKSLFFKSRYIIIVIRFHSHSCAYKQTKLNWWGCSAIFLHIRMFIGCLNTAPQICKHW